VSASVSDLFVHRGQTDCEGRPAPDGRIHRYTPAVLRHNTITDRKAETCPAPNLFCGEERIENLGEVFLRDADARIAYLQRDAATLIVRAQTERAALRHRINRVLGEDDDDLLQLARVACDERDVVGHFDLKLYVLRAPLMAQQPRRRFDH